MSFQFNPQVADQIVNALYENRLPMTAREISKEIGVDKHVVNQHLYKIEGMVKSAHRIPVWSLPDEETHPPPPPDASIYVQNLQGEISTMPFNDFLEVEHLYFEQFETLPNGFMGYRMRPLAITNIDPQPIEEMD
jgi:hypothetical protein